MQFQYRDLYRQTERSACKVSSETASSWKATNEVRISSYLPLLIITTLTRAHYAQVTPTPSQTISPHCERPRPTTNTTNEAETTKTERMIIINEGTAICTDDRIGPT